MSMPMHTPGPWQGCLHLRSNADETCGCGYRGGIWSTSADVMICEMGRGTELGADMTPVSDRATQIADARLIAAAPDMYTAASRLLAVFDLQKMTQTERIIVGVSDAGLRTEGNAAIVALRAAIAKATNSPASGASPASPSTSSGGVEAVAAGNRGAGE